MIYDYICRNPHFSESNSRWGYHYRWISTLSINVLLYWYPKKLLHTISSSEITWTKYKSIKFTNFQHRVEANFVSSDVVSGMKVVFGINAEKTGKETAEWCEPRTVEGSLGLRIFRIKWDYPSRNKTCFSHRSFLQTHSPFRKMMTNTIANTILPHIFRCWDTRQGRLKF